MTPRLARWLGGGWGLALLAAVAAWTFVSHVPAALAFPYRAQLGADTILSERRIDPAITRVLARADALTAASPLAVPGLRRTIVLTDGGWRWRVLALTSAGAFGVRRPFNASLTFNRNGVADDRVWNSRAIGGTRTLSGTIAHETTHLLVERRYGALHAAWLPLWKREGYADFVAQESSLSDGDAKRLRRSDPGAAPLAYFDARRRVAAALRANGGSVDALLR